MRVHAGNLGLGQAGPARETEVVAVATGGVVMEKGESLDLLNSGAQESSQHSDPSIDSRRIYHCRGTGGTSHWLPLIALCRNTQNDTRRRGDSSRQLCARCSPARKTDVCDRSSFKSSMRRRQSSKRRTLGTATVLQA